MKNPYINQILTIEAMESSVPKRGTTFIAVGKEENGDECDVFVHYDDHTESHFKTNVFTVLVDNPNKPWHFSTELFDVEDFDKLMEYVKEVLAKIHVEKVGMGIRSDIDGGGFKYDVTYGGTLDELFKRDTFFSVTSTTS